MGYMAEGAYLMGYMAERAYLTFSSNEILCSKFFVRGEQCDIAKLQCDFLNSQSVAVDESGMYFAIAGRMGVAHYSLLSRRWKLFGNESQVKLV